MSQYLQVAEDESEEPIELPSEDDGTLHLSTLVAQFPGASGLKYRNPETGALRGIRLVEGRLHPPDGIWGNMVYFAVFPKENKRKGDETLENPNVKTKRLDSKKCSDLIVLGLPWKSTEDDLKAYFSQFGEVIMAQVLIATYLDHQDGFHKNKKRKKLAKNLSKAGQEGYSQVNRKIFVGRCSEDMTADELRNYFAKFGEVIDVFIPKPFRAFAFVTFADADVAQSLCGEDHIIKGASVHVSNAAPKSQDKSGMGQKNPMGMGGGNQGYGQQGGWGNQNSRGSSQQGGFGSSGSNSMGGNNMGNNPLGMGFNLGALGLNPAAMMAAAQAALAGQAAGWTNLLGMNQGGQGSQGTGDATMSSQSQVGYGMGTGSSMGSTAAATSNQGFGNMGWGGTGATEGAGDGSSGWGQSKATGGWN
ncbi:TAR DNA-binding protein 43 [Lingula anatina]|uniref:TAR DNA-binding protein 43 n=1 Tax=Lingula anatina TaxID=7574 RepID=A0A1S3I0Q8_LINAN|nr:TAR DNA-binding protein 43 [Lingula anatina]|eukprot:XP_013391411.1 TAR DNA-binding protein 43 [Lingula anatina]